MSNDLISRSAVISLIDELGYVNCHNSKDFEANSKMDKIRQGVIELPTAYDADKVVREMKKVMNNRLNLVKSYEESGNFELAEIYSLAVYEYRNAIKIAKSGGMRI